VRPPVALDKPGDDVGAPPAPTVALGEHGVGLADAGGRAQVDAERAYLFDLAGGRCLRRCLRRRDVARALDGPLRAVAPDLLGDLGGLPLRGSPLPGSVGSMRVSGYQITSRPLSILTPPSPGTARVCRLQRV
jgi:hypothetical protein